MPAPNRPARPAHARTTLQQLLSRHAERVDAIHRERAELVDLALATGWTWAQIGDVLGVNGEAARSQHRRYVAQESPVTVTSAS